MRPRGGELSPGQRKEEPWQCADQRASPEKESPMSEMLCRLTYAGKEGSNQCQGRILLKSKHIMEIRNNNNETCLSKRPHCQETKNVWVTIEEGIVKLLFSFLINV